MTQRRITLVGLVIAGAVGVVSATGLADGANSPNGSRAGSAGSLQRAAHLAVFRRARSAASPRLSAHFAIFRRAYVADSGTALSAAPPGVQHVLSNYESAATRTAFVASLGLNVEGIRHVQSAEGDAWVVPGAHGACITTPVAAPAVTGSKPYVRGIVYTTCNDTNSILQEGLVSIGSKPDGTAILFGLVPDGNNAVVVTPSGGTPQTIPVITNVVIAEVRADSVTLTFRNANGASVSNRYGL